MESLGVRRGPTGGGGAEVAYETWPVYMCVCVRCSGQLKRSLWGVYVGI